MTTHSSDPFAAIAEMARTTKIASIEQEAMRDAREALNVPDSSPRMRAFVAVAHLDAAVRKIARLEEGRP